MSEAMWIDSHAHLSLLPRREVVEVLERAASAGVGGVLVPASGASDLEAVLELGSAFPARVVGAVGVHPHEASTLDAALKRRLERSLASDSVVAVGEIGLDYHYMSSPREDQLESLAWQLDLACELDRPVILHNRESWPDLEPALRARAGRLRGVCHSFCEGPDEARTVVELGLLLGISGMLTFGWAEHVREAVRAVGPEHLLVETDSPYLAPVPHRGRRNEPAYVALVGERLAAELGVEARGLQTTTARSFRTLLRLPASWPGTAAV
jgi:TatD DNase family protein